MASAVAAASFARCASRRARSSPAVVPATAASSATRDGGAGRHQHAVAPHELAGAVDRARRARHHRLAPQVPA